MTPCAGYWRWHLLSSSARCWVLKKSKTALQAYQQAALTAFWLGSLRAQFGACDTARIRHISYNALKECSRVVPSGPSELGFPISPGMAKQRAVVYGDSHAYGSYPG